MAEFEKMATARGVFLLHSKTGGGDTDDFSLEISEMSVKLSRCRICLTCFRSVKFHWS